MEINHNRDSRGPRVRPSSAPTQLPSPAKKTELDGQGGYGVLDNKAFPNTPGNEVAVAATPKAAATPIGRKVLGQVIKIDHRIQADLRQQHRLIKTADRLYSERSNIAITPPSQSILASCGRALSWLAAKVGIVGADSAISKALREARAKATAKIEVFKPARAAKGEKKIEGEKKEAVVKPATTSLLEEAKEVSKLAKGCTVLVGPTNRRGETTPGVPAILKAVSIPVDKKHIPFEDLKNRIRAIASKSQDVRVHMPSSERIVLYRRLDDKSWESIEISWRGLTKATIIDKTGVSKVASSDREGVYPVFNQTALEYAKRFMKFEAPPLKRRDKTKTELRRVIDLSKEIG